MSARVLLLALLALACAEQPVELPLRSLERSGKSAFVCVDSSGNGVDIDACPDHENGETRLLALVTQTLRGEVAVVDLTNETVVDTNPAIPGFSFLPVGANPLDIVALPSGVATFVAAGELGKEGLYALPTAGITQPHDLTDWPACSLPEAPSALALLPASEACAAGTTLAVALPNLGEVWVVDVQDLLERPPGGFAACTDLVRVSLQNQASGPLPSQVLPPDLQTPASCGVAAAPIPIPGLSARPVDLAQADARLYVADQGAPLVHVLDVSNPCAVRETEPLLPMSFEQPWRTVQTKKVAVSPETTEGQRFVYAIDDTEGSVMVFDVSRGATDRTPLVRSGTPRTPFEPADRIAFGGPAARDVEFVLHDIPKPDEFTGVSVSGTLCDPDPALPEGDPGVLLRPNSTRTRGAGPRVLRGIFGMVALASGEVVVVDVEDWDGKCRRPSETNPSDQPDFRGCLNDPATPFERENAPTVSDEFSCSVVEPHRARSANYFISTSSSGVRAAALRTPPRLGSEQGLLPTDQTAEGRQHPKLLAVPFPRPWPVTSDPSAPGTNRNLCGDVWVGTTRLRAFCEDSATPIEPSDLPFDPGTATTGSLLLSQVQPRAHATEDVSVTYEGRLVPERFVGILSYLEKKPENANDARLVLKDADAGFCGLGVQDIELAAEASSQLPLQSGVTPEAFGRRHADYVQITGDFLPSDDRYWSTTLTCTAPAENRRSQCESLFGGVETPSTVRDFRVLGVRQSRLLLEPRDLAGLSWPELQGQLECCFPSAVSYTVRAGHQWIVAGSASGFRHDLFTDPAPIPPPPTGVDPLLQTFEQDRRCIRVPECNPRRQLFQSRVFEVSSSTTCTEEMTEADESLCGVGSPSGEGDDVALACQFAFEPNAQWLNIDDPDQARCVFQNVTSRFAIYRGALPSQRDYSFLWQTAGGFAPLFTELATAQSSAVLPQSLEFVPQLNQVAVADGASQGLVLIDLDTVRLRALYF